MKFIFIPFPRRRGISPCVEVSRYFFLFPGMRPSPDRQDSLFESAPSRRAFLSVLAAGTAAACSRVFGAERTPPAPLRFDGSSHARVPDFAYDGTHPLTVEVTAKPERVDRDQTILGNQHGGGWGFVLENGHWTFLCHNGEQYAKAVSDAPARAGEEASLMAVCDGRAIRLYVDGVLQKDVVPWTGRHKASKQPLLLGADPDGTGKPQHHFAGGMRDLRVSAVSVDTMKRWRTFDLSRARPDHVLLLDGQSDGVASDRSKARQRIELRP
jgi:hypothetical protein